MPDAWRAYLEMALGLTEAPRKRAQKVVGELANRGGATAAQLQGLVEDLVSAGMANREALTNIVRYEVDKALGVVGLATAEEVDELTKRVRDLETQLRAAEAKASAGAGEPTAGGTRIERPAPLPRKVAKKAPAKKAVKATPNAMPSAGTTPATPATNVPPAKKAVAKKAVKKAPGVGTSPVAPVKAAAEAVELPPAKKAPAKTTPAKTTPEKATPAKTTPEKATPAKKTAAKKAPAKKAAPPTFISPETKPLPSFPSENPEA
jgi:polyhydroxyalkanoate synthesis regulator phasin